MRTMMKVTIPVEAGNRAIKDGSLPRILQTAMETLKPEAAYFPAMEGSRTAIFVFDMQDSAQLPPIVEPFFMELNATVDVFPVMNAEDVQKGLQALQSLGKG